MTTEAQQKHAKDPNRKFAARVKALETAVGEIERKQGIFKNGLLQLDRELEDATGRLVQEINSLKESISGRNDDPMPTITDEAIEEAVRLADTIVKKKYWRRGYFAILVAFVAGFLAYELGGYAATLIAGYFGL